MSIRIETHKYINRIPKKRVIVSVWEEGKVFSRVVFCLFVVVVVVCVKERERVR